MHILVTAGPTRESLDPVRFISNRSSGKTGYQIAAAAVQRGHRVTFVSGPVALPAPKGAATIQITTAEQLYRACLRAFPNVDVVIMTAAVCDYRPKRQMTCKLKKGAETMLLDLVQTKDTLAELGRRKRPGQILIGFALEDRRPKASAQAKLIAKNLDAIVLNAPSALADERSKVSVFRNGRWDDWPVMTKRTLAGRLVRLAERLNRDVRGT